MPRKPSRFRQQDVTRALKAVAAAGIAIDTFRLEIGIDGKIVVLVGASADGATALSAPPDANDFGG